MNYLLIEIKTLALMKIEKQFNNQLSLLNIYYYSYINILIKLFKFKSSIR